MRHGQQSDGKDATPYLLGCVALFAFGGLLTLLFTTFPSQYDELQHLSFIAALRDAPTLFPQYGTYRVLASDLRTWSDASNYLAHPPLYYLLLAPLGTDVTMLRAVNLAMAVAGFALCAGAGVSLLTTKVQRIAFLMLLLFFSKPALIAGMISNDNLVLLETGAVLWLLAKRLQKSDPWGEPYPEELAQQASRRMADAHGVTSSETPLSAAPKDEDRWGAIFLALLLACVGWTKFNAFVGLTTFVGAWHLLEIARGGATLFGRNGRALLAGVCLGAIPTVANLATLGVPAYVPADFLFVPPSVRPSYDFLTFAEAFFDKIGRKVLFADGIANMLPALVGVTCLALFAPLSRATRRTRDIATAGLIAMLTFAALHLTYGWRSFLALGTTSDAQSRYYVMLWPTFALAIVVGGSVVLEFVIARTAKRPAVPRLLRRSRS